MPLDKREFSFFLPLVKGGFSVFPSGFPSEESEAESRGLGWWGSLRPNLDQFRPGRVPDRHWKLRHGYTEMRLCIPCNSDDAIFDWENRSCAELVDDLHD